MGGPLHSAPDERSHRGPPLSTLAAVHQRLGFALLLVFLVGMVLAAAATRRPSLLATTRAYLWLSFAALAVQAVLGLVIFAGGEPPPQGLHFLYGPLAFVSLPIASGLSRGGTAQREAWLLAAGFVAALLFAFRALATG